MIPEAKFCILLEDGAIAKFYELRKSYMLADGPAPTVDEFFKIITDLHEEREAKKVNVQNGEGKG